MKITILNQKGGVGKTTVTTNLGYGLALRKKKTLVIDTDPQANCSSIFFDSANGVKTINDLFMSKGMDIRGTIYPARADGQEVKNLFILPVGKKLDDIEQQITTKINRQKLLDGHLRNVENDYDFVIIDCRPTLGPFSENAIYTSDLILIPTNCSKFSLDGISDLFAKVKDVKETENFRYKILRNLYDLRATQSNAVINSELERFQDNLLKTIIRRSEPINQAQMSEETVFTFAPTSNGAIDFKNLVKEILNHV
jgi:chromosome partitioning protein